MTDDDPSDRRLCVECIGEPWLAGQIVKDGETAVCNYCGRTEKTETITELADRFEGMITRHFEREDDVDYRYADLSVQSDELPLEMLISVQQH